ncbi:DUF3667 domain-containing protein [candidate division KSB1 bacterium]|nr:DUF3667 domain-containing protein [candidate division KSB1 bacterium]
MTNKIPGTFLKKRIKSSQCLNCGQQIDNSNFCPYCGQENHSNQISIWTMVRDFFGDYFAFDSKLFKSIVPLLFKPGFLTAEYVRGRRKSYVAPLRLYIFATFIFFFITGISGLLNTESHELFATKRYQQAAGDSLHVILKEFENTGKLQDRERLEHQFKHAMDQILSPSSGRVIYGQTKVGMTDSTSENQLTANVDTMDGSFSQFLHNKAERMENLGEQGEQLLLQSIIDNIPKVLFLLLPVFAMILYMLYIRHSRYYIEHFVFSLHVHTFIFVLLILALLMPFDFMPWIVVLGTHLYLFAALVRFYGQGWLKTGFKFALLMTSYVICLIPASILLVILALSTM